MSQLPLPPEATLIWTKKSHLTKSSTSRTPSYSSGLSETFVLVAIETPVTPTISGTPVPKEEVSQLLKDISTDPSETVIEAIQ